MHCVKDHTSDSIDAKSWWNQTFNPSEKQKSRNSNFETRYICICLYNRLSCQISVNTHYMSCHLCECLIGDCHTCSDLKADKFWFFSLLAWSIWLAYQYETGVVYRGFKNCRIWMSFIVAKVYHLSNVFWSICAVDIYIHRF